AHTNRAALPSAATVTRTVLDNGLIILVRENFSAPVVAIEGCIPCGSLHEAYVTAHASDSAAHLRGLASFTASMLTRGSRNYTQDAFDAAIEDVGASLGAGADAHLTNFGATSLAEDFSTMVDVLADILRYPTFPAEQVARMRKRRLVFLQERDHDSAHWAAMRFSEAIYGKTHPYGYPVSGSVETVGRMEQADLAAFHEQFYTPHGAIVVVAGAIRADEAVDRLAAAFGGWQGRVNDHTVPSPDFAGPGHSVRAFAQGKVQNDLLLGAPAPGRGHADHYAVRVANTILGQFGLMGRLGEMLREEMGIAYYVSSQYEATRGLGTWSASVGTNPEHVPAAAAAIVAEFHRLGHEVVDDAELEDAQAYMTGVLPLALETNAGVASTLLTMEWQQLGMDYLLHYPDLINQVTAADVQRVAQTYLCDAPLWLAVAGPAIPGALPLDLLAGGQTVGRETVGDQTVGEQTVAAQAGQE
ncbi:MAG: pitrilysin family protein, partial [Litorilinea sp.]